MSNNNFETRVLGALDTLTSDVWELKTDVKNLTDKVDFLDKKVDTLDNKIDTNTDRLEDLIVSQGTELKETMNLQWRYVNQAFEVISSMQNEKYRDDKKKHFV